MAYDKTQLAEIHKITHCFDPHKLQRVVCSRQRIGCIIHFIQHSIRFIQNKTHQNRVFDDLINKFTMRRIFSCIFPCTFQGCLCIVCLLHCLRHLPRRDYRTTQFPWSWVKACGQHPFLFVLQTTMYCIKKQNKFCQTWALHPQSSQGPFEAL